MLKKETRWISHPKFTNFIITKSFNGKIFLKHTLFCHLNHEWCFPCTIQLHFRIFLKNVITLISFFMAVFRISGYPVKLTVATQLIGTICPIDLKTFLANDGLCSCERWNLKPLFCIYSNDSLVLSNVRFSNFKFFRFNFISKNVYKVYMGFIFFTFHFCT